MRINQIRCDMCKKVLDKYVALTATSIAPPPFEHQWDFEVCILCFGKIERLIKSGAASGDH